MMGKGACCARQVDKADSGFSFSKNAPLDMCMAQMLQ